MQATDLKPGMLLRLSGDVQNPRPDRRKKYEYEAQPIWKAGTLFVVREDRGFELRGERVGQYLYLSRVNRADRFGPSTAGFEPLVLASEPVQETLASVIDVSTWSGNAGPACKHVVEQLLKSGRISLDDVRQVLEVDADDESA